MEKFSRWLRAVCTILLARNNPMDRTKAIGYIEQATNVLQDQCFPPSSDADNVLDVLTEHGVAAECILPHRITRLTNDNGSLQLRIILEWSVYRACLRSPNCSLSSLGLVTQSNSSRRSKAMVRGCREVMSLRPRRGCAIRQDFAQLSQSSGPIRTFSWIGNRQSILLQNHCLVMYVGEAKISCQLGVKSRSEYSKTRPRVFPTAIYSLCAEKSMLVTRPRGVLDVGQFRNTVREAR